MLRAILHLGAILSLAAASARAASTPFIEHPEVGVRLLSAPAPPGGALRLGIHFRLAPGWHAYWKSSGDAGFPPAVDVAGSRGLGSPVLLWPAPHRFEMAGGLDSIGYAGEVVHPVSAAFTGAAASFVADVDYLVCAEECVPYRDRLALDIPAGGPEPDPEAARLIDAFASRVPAEAASVPSLSITSRLEGSTLVATIETPEVQDPRRMDLFFEPHDAVAPARPSASASSRAVTLRVDLRPLAAGPLPAPLVLPATVTGLSLGGRPLSVQTVLRPSAATGAPAVVHQGLLWMMLAGLAGGLLLNVMPCVLPVLSIKVFGILRNARASSAEARAHALLTAAGILGSFAVLGLAVVAGRSAGISMGWGIQFQEPVFVAFLAVVVTAVALNLWGLLEVGAPAAVMQAAGRAPRHGAAGHLFSGFLATLLATPCSAPFLGTAVAFAMAAEAPAVFATLLAVGTGMASPYLLLAAWPAALRWLPRPGSWMETLRHALGFPMAATVVWLLYVLSRQMDGPGLALVELLLVGMGLGAWARARASRPAARAAAMAILLFSAGTAIALAHVRRGGPPATDGIAGAVAWRPFDAALARRLADSGTPVFVDVTADWCFTCKVNERLVLERPAVAERFRDLGVVPMRADWTNRDDAIGAYLSSFGRAGIPFYAYYHGPGAPTVLPELLTERVVLDALSRSPIRAAGLAPLAPASRPVPTTDLHPKKGAPR